MKIGFCLSSPIRRLVKLEEKPDFPDSGEINRIDVFIFFLYIFDTFLCTRVPPGLAGELSGFQACCKTIKKAENLRI